MSESLPTLFARLSLAFSTFVRLLADARYAAKILSLPDHDALQLPKAIDEPSPAHQQIEEAEVPKSRDLGPALQLLGVLQREGRLVDFVQQEIAGFSDADVGAAARVVHQGCRRALEQTVAIESIRNEGEGSALTLAAGFDSKAHRLVGNVQGQPPYRGTLRHRGWRATRVILEDPLASADLTVICPAEVEL